MPYLEIQNAEILLGIFTFFITSYLGVSIFIHNRASWTSRIFFILSLLIDAYIVINYLSLHPPVETPENQLFWIRLVMFICSFIGPTVLLLAHTFPHDNFKLKKKFLIPLIFLLVASAYASITDLVFRSIEYPAGVPMPIAGKGVLIFFLDFVGLFILSFIILLFKYRRSNGQEKKQNQYFILGVIATFSFMAISTVISVVIFKTSATVFLGPLSSVMLMTFVAYAIFKHKLFKIQMIATEVLVFLLIIVIILEGFVAGSIGILIYKIIFAILVGFVGFLLVKSVREEIERRDEVARLAHSLKKANLRLKELDQQKTEFLSIASHQLRTPLSVIKSYVAMILDGDYGRINKNVKQVLQDMEKSNERLVKLIDNFLDISRIEQGRTKFIFIELDLCSMVQSVIEELKQRAADKGLKIDWQAKACPTTKIMGDEEKIRHVIYNFIDNAIKYSEHGDIRVIMSPESNGFAVKIKDHGLGFGQIDQANFFQKFYRGENVKGINVNGTGLGLYVCRKFIEAHHGRIWGHSQGKDKGSEFGFWVPVKQVNRDK
ncbi:MAG: hypothetical protein COU31_00335 [Candidatus Magasanikbacteria bacterium CG10_big_fil_rev_8_21_14_0_10_40_10]|uniref:histidine kinase n=1 Tax=Candidatus Magasanikbacteria bacterium CG10_big_fil_rev_8_21_14_0_10_40_10 TaxID=1974648 RepID=A0A2M6W545_9BACT|nr:MAG: hypothetical protein COU31_00335 [Candidatus Magasanikbacteria bacterium CG10_big_fil_rev_8_21_14_0_10_40_10]